MQQARPGASAGGVRAGTVIASTVLARPVLVGAFVAGAIVAGVIALAGCSRDSGVTPLDPNDTHDPSDPGDLGDLGDLGDPGGSDGPVDDPNEPADNAWFPLVIERLTDDEQQARAAALQERNPGLCARVGPYGDVEFSPFCDDPDEGALTESEAIEKAYDFLDRNRSAFGLGDDPLPDVESARHSSTGVWSFDFSEQQVEGLPVLRTTISLSIADDVFKARGRHYPGIELPREYALTPEDARRALPWTAFRYFCWTLHDLRPRDSVELKIAPARAWVFDEDPDRQSDVGDLEVRLFYEFEMEDHRYVYQAAYIDVMTGKSFLMSRVFCREVATP